MDLIVKTDTAAPSKSAWHDPDPTSRKSWSSIYETITTWFCSSHDFNHQDNLIILYEKSLIKLEGQSIRYLGPSLRSAASLVSKAFQTLKDLETSEIEESTPGIFVYQKAEQYEFPKPYFSLKLGSPTSISAPDQGSLFTYIVDATQEYYVPGSRIAQGLVWFLQRRFL